MPAAPARVIHAASSADVARLSRVKGLLSEYRGLAPDELQAVMIQLQATLGSATTTATNDYKVPGDMDLFVLQMWAFLRFTALDAEDQTILGFLNLTPTERWLVKAQNCTVRVENVDNKNRFTENNDPNLSSMMPPMGYPVVWLPEAPMVVPKGHTVRGTFTLQDTDSDIVSGNTVYGVSLVGVLVPRDD